MLRLSKLMISRHLWGADAGKLCGEIEIEGTGHKVTLILSEDQAAKIVDLVAGAVVSHAQDVAKLMVADVVSTKALLPGKAT